MAGSRPLCVVLDSNQWIQHQLLRSGHGAALLYALDRHGGVLGVPEVVERELKAHYRQRNAEAVKAIESAKDALLKLHGRVPDPAYPSTEQAEKAIDDRLSELSDTVEQLPITPAHREAATNMVFDSVPPSSATNQQYKDCLLWQAVLEMARSFDIYFVTHDKAFYAGRNHDRGLARNLAADLESDKLEVTPFSDLDSCLTVLGRDTPELDYAHIGDRIYAEIFDQLSESAQRQDNLRPSDDIFHQEITPFATGLTGRVALSFALESVLLGPGGDAAGHVVCRGKCSYLTGSDEVADVQLSEFEFTGMLTARLRSIDTSLRVLTQQ